MGFKGKTVLVTGGGTGIGEAIAHRFAEEGANIVVMGRRSDPIERVARALGGLAVQGDAGDRVAAEHAVSQAIERFGGIDVLVPNAGTVEVGDALSTDDAAWESSLRNNLTSAFLISRAALPSLIARGGSIVIVASLAAVEAIPQCCSYIVSKHALIGLTRSLALDFGPRGVRVNAVCPGFVRTPMADQTMAAIMARDGITQDQAYSLVTADQPVARPAEPDDVANVCRFLASKEAAMITGSYMLVDGGSSIVCTQMLRANFEADARRIPA